jgi:hypothetical protein
MRFGQFELGRKAMKDDITAEELSKLLKNVFHNDFIDYDSVATRLADVIAASQDADGQVPVFVVSQDSGDGDTSSRASIVLVSQNNSDGDTSSHNSIVVVMQDGTIALAGLDPTAVTLQDGSGDIQFSLPDHLTPQLLNIDSIFG